MNGEQIPTAVEFATNIVVSHLPFYADGHVETDMSVTGMQLHVGGKGFRQLQRDAAVAGMKTPTRTDG